MLSSNYDFNLWSRTEGRAALSAYRIRIGSDGLEETDTHNFTSIEFDAYRSGADSRAIRFLLDSFDVAENVEGLDEWCDDRAVFCSYLAPDAIRDWVQLLPSYVQQDWSN